MTKASLAHQFYIFRRPIVAEIATSDTIVDIIPDGESVEGVRPRHGPAIFKDDTPETMRWQEMANTRKLRQGSRLRKLSCEPTPDWCRLGANKSVEDLDDRTKMSKYVMHRARRITLTRKRLTKKDNDARLLKLP